MPPAVRQWGWERLLLPLAVQQRGYGNSVPISSGYTVVNWVDFAPLDKFPLFCPSVAEVVVVATSQSKLELARRATFSPSFS